MTFLRKAARQGAGPVLEEGEEDMVRDARWWDSCAMRRVGGMRGVCSIDGLCGDGVDEDEGRLWKREGF